LTTVAFTVERAHNRFFYVWMASAFIIIAFGGFAETYWLQVPAGTFVGAPIVHLHALIFSLWPLLFLTQTLFAATGRMQYHRGLGIAGVSLATAMVFVGLAAAVNTLSVGLAAGYGDKSRAFLLVPVTAITTFAGFFVAALSNIARPDWHKRFMLVATAALLQAAIARVFFVLITGGGPGLRPGLGEPPTVKLALGAGLIASALLLPGMVVDWRTRGRPHPAYLIGFGLSVLVVLARWPLSATPAWLAVANFLRGFG
jgi:hypothetical protein